MATTIFGHNPARNDFFFSDGASENQAWDASVTVSDVGRIQSLTAFFAGDTAACTGGPVLWSSGGSVLLYTALSIPISSGTSNSPDNQFYETSSGFDLTFASGTSFINGAFRNSSQTWVFGFEDFGSLNCEVKTVSGSSPGAATGGTSLLTATGRSQGVMDAYSTYFVCQTYIWRSGAWHKIQDLLRRSGGYNTPAIYVRRSGGWTQIGQLAQRQELDWKRELVSKVVWPDGSWERALSVWHYDQLSYFGHGFPSDPDRRARRIVTPRPYELRLAA